MTWESHLQSSVDSDSHSPTELTLDAYHAWPSCDPVVTSSAQGVSNQYVVCTLVHTHATHPLLLPGLQLRLDVLQLLQVVGLSICQLLFVLGLYGGKLLLQFGHLLTLCPLVPGCAKGKLC